MMSPDSRSEQTPEFYRQRYLTLKARGQDANSRSPAQAPSENPRKLRADLVIAEETIPGGWYWSCRLTRGTTLRLLNDEATPGVSVLLWNANDPSERYNPADTVKVQWTSRLTRGKLLLSDMGRVLASLTHSSGNHDALAGGSTSDSNARKYGTNERFRNTRDNFLLAAAKHGLSPRDVGPCIGFFEALTTDRSGRLLARRGPAGAPPRPRAPGGTAAPRPPRRPSGRPLAEPAAVSRTAGAT